MLLNYAIGEDLRVPWSTRRSNQSTVKEISPEFIEKTDASWSSNTLAIWCEELIHWKRPWCWERLKAREKGATEDGMVGWQHWFNGHEFGQAPGIGNGQAYCTPWGCKESDMTEWLNWTELKKLNNHRIWKRKKEEAKPIILLLFSLSHVGLLWPHGL